jgi:hypothetical protein
MDLWLELAAEADTLRGEIAVLSRREDLSLEDQRYLFRMIEEARRFLRTPGDPDDHPQA